MRTGATAEGPLTPFVDGSVDRADFEIVPPTAAVDPLHTRGLLAGATEVDITPPPGMPKAGFSRLAHDGAGFRTRLRARVLHLRQRATSLAIVQLDAMAGSALLQHLIAQAIAGETDVPLAGLMVGATHTHAAPAQFDASAFYNRFASNRPGFDPAWTQFLVERIAGAVIEAVATRRPARLAWGDTDIWGLTRNRSLAPYVLNDTVGDKRLEPQRKFAAVNPTLQLLRVDAQSSDGGHEPLAAMAIFSVHGTGISHHCHEYHADVWAYLASELRTRIDHATGHRPVVGAIEGTHADCAPAIRPGRAGFPEAERVGRGIGAEAAAVFQRLEGQLSDEIELASGVRELDLDHGADAIEDVRLARPLLGASQVAGAKENTTPVLHLVPPFRAGWPKPFASRTAHGSKWALASRWLQPRILPTRGFPRVLTLQVLRIGTRAIVGVPFEITVEAGRRVADAVEATGIGRPIVSSVVNGYCGYCTTAEEYRLQYYEGGHNLHGPSTQAWIAAQAARLAGELAKTDGHLADVLPARRFLLPVRRYLATPMDATGMPRTAAGPLSYHDPINEDYGWWEFRWHDAPPGGLAWHEPIARVERSDTRDGWIAADDDQGCNLSVTHVARDDGRDVYAARWYDPWLGGGRRHRFVVVGNNGRQELASEPFD